MPRQVVRPRLGLPDLFYPTEVIGLWLAYHNLADLSRGRRGIREFLDLAVRHNKAQRLNLGS